MTDDTNALSWWHAKKALRGSRNEWWALAGCGRYVVALYGDYWNVASPAYGHAAGGANSAWPSRQRRQWPSRRLTTISLGKIRPDSSNSAVHGRRSPATRG